MKKTILSIICVIAMLLSLSACVTNAAEDAKLAQLSDYAATPYDSYTIQIVTTNRNGGKVTQKHSVAVIDGVRNVTSRTETINSFVIDGESITAPDEYMTVTESTTTVNVSDSTAFGLPSFKFSRDALTNIKWDEESYPYVMTADITSTAAFMQDDLDGTGFKLEVEYVTGSIYSLQISYKAVSGNNITVIYTFG